VDHALNDAPLIGGNAMGPGFAVDDAEAQGFDLLGFHADHFLSWRYWRQPATRCRAASGLLPK
jgi:hypothetical protein